MKAGVVVVTGGARGLRRPIVAEAARRGHHVVFNHRGDSSDIASTRETAAGAGGTVTGVEADIRDAVGVSRLAAAARDIGPVGVLITCAAIPQAAALADITDQDWREAFAFNVTAPMLLARELASDLAATGGAILNVSSDEGTVGSGHGVCAGASRAGTVGLSHTLARELAPHVRVNTMVSGPIDADLWAGLAAEDRRRLEDATPLGRVGTAVEIARAALDLCSWTYVTGQTLVVNGGRVLS